MIPTTEDLRIFLIEVNDEIGSAHPETRDTKISARLFRDILTELLANREAQPVAEVVSKYGDPEAFGEREIRVLADLQKIPYDTKLFTTPPAPAVPDDDPRDAFERYFKMPKHVERVGKGYCLTEHSAWQGQEFITRYDGWNACRAAILANL